MEPVWAPILTEEIRSNNSMSEPPQYILFDPVNGNYVARYIPSIADASKASQPLIVPIRFRVETEVAAELSMTKRERNIEYRCAFRNGAAAKYPSVSAA